MWNISKAIRKKKHFQGEESLHFSFSSFKRNDKYIYE